MSLSIDGVWKAGVWATTVWANGVWSEGAYVPPSSIVLDSIGGKSHKKRSHLGHQHERLPFTEDDLIEAYSRQENENLPPSRNANVADDLSQELSHIDKEIQKYLVDMGVVTPEEIIRNQEKYTAELAAKRRKYLAAIILLFD